MPPKLQNLAVLVTQTYLDAGWERAGSSPPPDTSQSGGIPTFIQGSDAFLCSTGRLIGQRPRIGPQRSRSCPALPYTRAP